MQAMLFAAGLGTRLKPLTDHMPKALVPVGGRPLLELTIETLKTAGVDDIVVNVHHFAQQIIDYVSEHDFGVRIRISDESDGLLDTGGGLKKALKMFHMDEPVLVHNVDILSNAPLQLFYRENDDYDVTLMVSERKTQRYLLFDDNMRLVGWTNIATGEIRSPYNLEVEKLRMYAFSGIHLIHPRIGAVMEEWPEKFPIMDFYLKNCDRIHIHGVVEPNLRLLDVGKIDTLEEAEELFRNINSMNC